MDNVEIKKPKRGRKSKQELINSLIINKITDSNENKAKVEPEKILDKPYAQLSDTPTTENTTELIVSTNKKRGRKPKGGKIIQQVVTLHNMANDKPNIILHLKCSMKDLSPTNINNDIVSYNFEDTSELNYDILTNEIDNDINIDKIQTNSMNNHYEAPENEENILCANSANNKSISKKLKQLEQNLHINNINDKSSACFWCTYEFDNPPIYIPKYYIKETYQVYGCFCSPECSVAYLMEENIDSSSKFERYHFINHIYGKIFNYEKNIKPAPNPYYMLNKFYGNLTIQEYRSLLRNERLFLIVDKPLTRVMPELHEDNDDFILNHKLIPSNNNYQVKKTLQKKTLSKNNIFQENFGIQSSL